MPVLSNILSSRNSGVGGTNARASYAMISYNTSQGTGGIVFYDEEFMAMSPHGDMGTYNSYGNLTAQYMTSGAMHQYSAVFYGVTNSATTPSSNTTPLYVGATNCCGEFGNTCVDVYSDASSTPSIRMSDSQYNKHYLNIYAIDSTHSNKRIVYLLKSGTIVAVDRLFGMYNFPLMNTATYTVTSLNTSMQGSASYNKSLNRLVILSYSSSGGAFNVYTYNNLNFDAYPNPVDAFAAPGVTRTDCTASFATNWAVNDSESYYNPKVFLNNDGSIFCSFMFSSNSFKLYKMTLNGTSPATVTYQTTQSNTTSYGLPQGFQYGQRRITSRGGKSAVVFTPYYYYGSGISAYMLNRTNATYLAYQNAGSSTGMMPLPYKDNGWTFWFAGNCYSSNYSGGYFTATYMLNEAAAGTFTQIGGTRYLTQFTYPNTTNYPGLTQVTDYNLIIPNTTGMK